ncbi:MAG: cell division protein FtsQ/DivIB, partial [Desulfobulbaceae bacterium]|nr:cell division protein FtsQ/DivIB [Desulfobulbaceae bacterium]
NAILPKQNISELRVDARGGLILFLADRPFPVHLGRERLRTKYYQLTRVLHWLYAHKRFDATASIRMDYQPDKVLVALAGMV